MITKYIPNLHRDGVSQKQRMLEAFQPTYISVEERSIEDLIRFAQKFAKELKFFDDQNREVGDWQNFLGKDDAEQAQRLVAYLQKPEAFSNDPKAQSWLSRPHIALFLSFLQLLQDYSKPALNQLTHRHLDHYYRDVLRISLREAEPDQVHVLVNLARDEKEILLPKGTPLHAGKDEAGKEIIYQTDENLLVNQSCLTQMKSVFRDTDWKIYAVEDTTRLKEETLSGWKPFGIELTQRNDTLMKDEIVTEGTVGIAISSPMLQLQEGERIITFSLTCTGIDQWGVDLENRIKTQKWWQIALSQEEGWFYPGFEEGAVTVEANTLNFKIIINKDIAPIAPLLTDARAPGDPETKWPILKLTLNWEKAHTKDEENLYQLLQKLIIEKADLSVAVNGLQDVFLQNEQGTISPGKPFEPFGSSPSAGSSLYFSHPELVWKKLDNLTFHFPWMDLPDKFSEYYKNYPLVSDKSAFKTKLSLLNRKESIELKDIGLFETIEDETTLEHEESKFPIDRKLHLTTGSDIQDWSRYFELKLTPLDFQHSVFPGLVALKTKELAIKLAGEDTANVDEYHVNPPYTPKLESFSLDYATSQEISLDSSEDQLFHLHPFGYSPMKDARKSSFLPQYLNEGELYLGIKDIYPSQIISLLFQISEGTADPDLKRTRIIWEYLSGNRWIPFRKDILSEETYDLTRSGIVQMLASEVKPNTILPAELYWIRVRIQEYRDSVCNLIDIHSQAVLATRGDAVQTHEPMLPGSIRKLVTPIAGIRGLKQPYASFGGRPMESEAKVNTRISERLRHKQRAQTPWDYERLVLDRFPQIYKAKCLAADWVGSSPGRGEIEVLVVPDLRNRQARTPFKPRTSIGLLEEIEDYLTYYAPAFAHIRVRNPRFKEVLVRSGVRLNTNLSDGYVQQKLQEDINRFLAPWAYDETADIEIGGNIYANSIIHFLEEQPHIDYVARFNLFGQKTDDLGKFQSEYEEEDPIVSAGQPDVILVPASWHKIDIIPREGYEETRFKGIGYMVIELDFSIPKTPREES